jgi:predicted DNA-binding transcriptional regulator AlpA
MGARDSVRGVARTTYQQSKVKHMAQLPLSLSIDESAEYLNLSVQLFTKYVKSGDLPPPMRISGPYRWLRRDLKRDFEVLGTTWPHDVQERKRAIAAREKASV